jgi:radical SAM superfamily enzyme YgiQ (UPF0313 family)
MTLLLVNPPCLRRGRQGSFFTDQKRNLAPSQYYSMPMEHLGIMSIAAFARSRDVEIACVNGMVSGHASVEETWQAMVEAARRHGTPTLVGFSNIDTLHEVVWLAERSRRHWEGVPVVLGNTMATLNHERILRTHDCIDYVVMGDGEHAFVQLGEAIACGGGAEQVPSLAWRDGQGAVHANPPRMVDIDALPPPARDELPVVLAEGFAGAVYTTRGCPYRCTFCGTGAVSGLLGRDSYRVRSVGNVVDEIEYLVRDFEIEFISITDDLFVSKHPSMLDRAARFGDEILRRGLDIRFMFDARLDSIDDLDLYTHLHRAGLRRVFIGLETGSYDQLLAYRKRLLRSGEDATTRIAALQDRGIEIIPGTIIFHPTVQPVELRATARLLRAIDYKTPRKFMDRITAYPGTPLHSDYAARGLLTSEWPVGSWQFADPEAQRLYDEVVHRIDNDPEITFDEAETFFLDRVGEWEAVIAARSGAPDRAAREVSV